jgi:hypothetical protein
VNLAPLHAAKWYRHVGQRLGNAAGIYVDGDEIGVVERWKPPAVMAGMTVEIANKIFDVIDGAPENARYSDHHLAKRKAWEVVCEHLPGCKKERAEKIIAAWIKRGLLIVAPFEDENRKARNGLFAVYENAWDWLGRCALG